MAITVSSAAESEALTTLTTIRSELGLDVESEQDALIDQYILEASRAIENYCRAKFAKQTITETLSSPGGKYMQLSRIPVVSITSITLEGVAVDAADYVLIEPESGIVFAEDGWTRTYGAYDYSVQYVYGYVLPSFSSGTINLPPDIELACRMLVKNVWFARSRDGAIRREQVEQVYEVEYKSPTILATNVNSMFTQEILALLAPYRELRL